MSVYHEKLQYEKHELHMVISVGHQDIQKRRCKVKLVKFHLLHFVAFFHVASLFSTWVDNEKALELDNRIFFFIFQPDFNVEISPKNATKHPVA